MRPGRPADLVLEYTQQMMAWRLFFEPGEQHRVAMLGLGAGSLLRHTLHHTPASVVTVELDVQVSAACRAWFGLPDTDRSVLVHADAAQWIADSANTGNFDVLQVDLYDANAQGPVYDSLSFYHDCSAVLADTGMMVVNLFGDHPGYTHNLDNISQAFKGRMAILPAAKAGNRIVLAFAPGATKGLSANALMYRAKTLQAETNFPMVRWARAIVRQLDLAAGTRA